MSFNASSPARTDIVTRAAFWLARRNAWRAMGFVSVLLPVGASLIGRRIGSVARWQTPSGGHAAAEVVTLHFQPEASGDYTK